MQKKGVALHLLADDFDTGCGSCVLLFNKNLISLSHMVQSECGLGNL